MIVDICVLQENFDTFLNDADQQDWQVTSADLESMPYDLDLESRTVVINNFGLSDDYINRSTYFRPQYDLATVEALRMARHVEWIGDRLNGYTPEAILQIGRICVADTQVHKILWAWRQKTDHGHDAPWKYLLASDLSDMVQGFLRVMEKDFMADSSGNAAIKKAMAVAFHQWFGQQGRVSACDRDTLGLIESMIDDYQTFGTRTLQPHSIGCLTPFHGRAASYLSGDLIADILDDPYYGGVHDAAIAECFAQIMQDVNCYRVGDIVFGDAALARRFAVSEG